MLGLLLQAWCLLLLPPLARGQAPNPTEYQVKANCLTHFPKFIEWPAASFASASSPLVICVLGEDQFGNYLDQVFANVTAGGHKVEIRRTRNISEATNCHMVFISRSESRRLPEVIKAVKREGVLLIGEHDQFLRSGGMINFYLEDNKVNFEIDDATAGNAGLKISSQLLKLGRKRR